MIPSKRRTKSETRISSYLQDNQLQKHYSQMHIHSRIENEPFFKRKTSAEMIGDVKSILGESKLGPLNFSGSGLRLVNTRRPVTPRDATRSLYGKVMLPGRPPSAFSMQYLQKDGNRIIKTPPLDSIIKSTTESYTKINFAAREHEFIGNDMPTKALTPRKLPALELKPKPQEVLSNAQADVKENKILELKTKNPQIHANTIHRHNGVLAQSTTERLIEILRDYAGLKDCSEETVAHINAILTELYERVRKKKHQCKRSSILGGIYGLVESTSPKILLSLSRVVLALCVTGSNLTGACKLIFKVARNEKNDHLFHNNDILELLIEGLGRANPIDDAEACIYGYGAIRFLTNKSTQERSGLISLKDTNKKWSELGMEMHATTSKLQPLHPLTSNHSNKENFLADLLLRYGAIDLMTLHLQLLNEAGARNQLTGPSLHSLYQLSAALRAFADLRQHVIFEQVELSEKTLNQNINSKLELVCPHLLRAAEVSFGEIEIQAYIVRTLSVLSEDSQCCSVLSEYASRIGMLFASSCEMLNVSPEKPLSLCSRLGYILGNIMAKSDEARLQFYYNDVALEYLTNILQSYHKKPWSLRNTLGDSVCDVLIKIMRVVANMSVNSEVGFGLGSTAALGQVVLDILRISQQSKATSEIFELTNATLGVLHNLCFYQDNSNTPAEVLKPVGSVLTILPQLTAELCALLQQTSDETICVEVMRVLGNLTRNDEARQEFYQNNGLQQLVNFLENFNSSHELINCIMGVLVNVLNECMQRATFLKLDGTKILLQHLSIALQAQEWPLATITSQALWNLFIDTPTNELTNAVSSEILNELNNLLMDHINEEIILEKKFDMEPAWEEFYTVAADLFEHLETVLGNTDNLLNVDNNELQKE